MRIIGGSHRGRTIHPPSGLPVRPTTDFAKSGLFNILAHKIDFEDIRVLDLCCGTGNISFEFASRGAGRICAIDQNLKCIQFVRNTAQQLNFTHIEAFQSEMIKYLKRCDTTFNIIFCDPPFKTDFILEVHQLVFSNKLLSPEGILIIEHDRENSPSNLPGFQETRNYGNVNFSFFRNFQN